MKIAIIRKKYSPFGGAERYLERLSSALTQGGHEVHVYANRWSDTGDSHVVVHHVPMIGGLSLLKVWSFALAALAVVKASSYDAILSNERLLSHDVFRVSDGVHRTWLRIRWRHTSLLKRLSLLINPLHWSVRFFDWYVFGRRAFRKIIAPSEFIKQDILHSYPQVREQDITVIYNGVDLAQFRPENKQRFREAVRKDLGVASRRVLLFVGTGFERKGLRYAIEALRYLPAETVLLVIGKGGTRRYRALAEQWDLGQRVIFLGPQKSVEGYYAASDLVVLPTLYEPMANVVLEALASGVPVVTSRDSGNAEMITEGKDGWIVDAPDDARDVARAVATATAHLGDPAIERHARSKAEQFTLDRAASRVLDVFVHLQSGRQSGSAGPLVAA